MIAISVLKNFAFLKDFTNDQLIKLESLANEENYQGRSKRRHDGAEGGVLENIERAVNFIQRI